MQNRWSILAILTAARLTMGFHFQTIGSTAPFFVDEMGVSYTAVGFLIGLYLLPGIVLAFPAGAIGKRFGDRRIVLIALLFMAIGSAIAGTQGTYETLVAGRLLSGVGAVFLNVLLTKMVTDWFSQKELVLAMAILLNAWPVGVGIALITLGPLAEAVSWQFVFELCAIVAGVMMLLVAFGYRDPTIVTTERSGTREILNLSSREIGLVSLAGIAWALFNVSYALLWSFAPSLLIVRGISVAEAGVFISVTTWLLVASVQIGGFIVQKFDRARTVIVVGITAFGLGMLVLPTTSMPLWILIAMGVFGGAPAAAIVALPARILATENRGPGFGVFSTWYYVMMAALPPIAGRLQDFTESAHAPIYFGGFVMLTALLFLTFLWILLRRSPAAT